MSQLNKNRASGYRRAAVGTAFAVGLSAAPLAAQAEANPFQVAELGNGYQLADKGSEGKCGEGKCGGDKGEARGEHKAEEGKCGGKDKESKGEKKGGEGKCGEGKCASS